MKLELGNTNEILSHKLFPPVSYGGVILRKRLLDDIINRPEGTRGVIFQAPAGFGKTTSLQQAMEAFKTRGWNSGWLSCDEGDNDPQRFQLHVQALLSPNNIFSGTENANDTSLLRLAESILHGFLNTKTPTILLFDEFQAIHNESVKNFFKFILPRLPKHVLIFIGTRTEPDIGLSTLLAHQVVILFQSDYLKFSDEEVQDFFLLSNNLEMSKEEVEAINSHAQGWPAALQLFRLALKNPDVRSSLSKLDLNTPRTLTEYLADNVLSGQPKNIQEFLIKTSILRKMSGDLCDFVTGIENSQKILDLLEKGGVFISSMGCDNYWFKYHSLFSSFLKSILEESYASQIPKIHNQAAKWFFEQNMHEDALHHALAAGDNAFAAEILNDWGSDLVIDINLVTMERWYDRIPFEQIQTRMDLAIKSAYALLFLRRRDKVIQLVDLLKTTRLQIPLECDQPIRQNLFLAMAKLFEDDLPASMVILEQSKILELPLPQGFAAFELAAAANLYAFGKLLKGDFEGVRISLLLAKNCANQIRSSFSNGYTLAVECISLIIQGRLKEVTSIFGSSDAIFRNQNFNNIEIKTPAALAVCQIWALYESNQINAACSIWSRYEEEITSALVPDFMAIGHIFASRAYYLRGELGKASAILDSLERISHSSQWGRIVDLVNLERIRISFLSNTSLAKYQIMLSRIKKRHCVDEYFPLSEFICSEIYISIKLFIQSRDFISAKKIISSEISNFQGRTYLIIKLLILNSLLENAKLNPREAKRILSQALQMAYTGGYVRSFIDEGPEIISLIAEIYDSAKVASSESDSVNIEYHKFLRKLLVDAGTDVNDSSFSQSSVKKLDLHFSNRQLEIIKLLVVGKSNKEIAACMFISENTVKFHLKNIFSELNISNRSQAIKVAREQNLTN